MRSLVVRGGAGLPWHQCQQRPQRRLRTRASNGEAIGRSRGYLEKVQGWQGPLKAAATSGSLSALGDVLAQLLAGQYAKHLGQPAARYDPLRTLRMLGFGACFYGPYQFYWYAGLDHLMPLKSTQNFLAKVVANQLLLAPVTLTAVFAWNLALNGKSFQDVQDKVTNDLLPTLLNGWKFWVPAASVNFYCVPLAKQVLYMSCCGVLWTGYLSYASSVSVSGSGSGGAVAKAA